MPLQFQVGRFFSGIIDQRTAVVTKIDGTQVRHQYQTVPAEFEIAVQRLAQHTANVGSARIYPALLHLSRYRRTTNIVVLLNHDDIEPGLCQVGGIGQTVMARADDNCVVFFHCNLVIAESHAPRYAPARR